MNRVFLFSIIYVSSVLIATISQVLLKTSAKKQYKSKIYEYLNPWVVIAYGLFFMSMMVTMYALTVVPLTLGGLLEGTGYIFILLFGHFFLQEKISKEKLIGSALIIAGITVYAVF